MDGRQLLALLGSQVTRQLDTGILPDNSRERERERERGEYSITRRFEIIQLQRKKEISDLLLHS